jgi:hypothetical protein
MAPASPHCALSIAEPLPRSGTAVPQDLYSFLMAKKSTTPNSGPTDTTPTRQGRFSQVRAAYRMTRQGDPRIGLIMIGIVLGVLIIFLAVGFGVGHPVYLGVAGLLLGLLAATVVFGRRAERSAYAQIEGQLGAAAGALNTIRRGWEISPGVAVNKAQDLVHRAVGRPGIVLVGEGAARGVTALLAAERKKLVRFLPDIPVYEVRAGSGEGEVPLRRLRTHLAKLPRTLRPAEVAEIDRKLKALNSMNVSMPKGPIPKNLRMPRGAR